MAATTSVTPSAFSVRLRTFMALHIGTNCGYFSTSATRSNMSDGGVADVALGGEARHQGSVRRALRAAFRRAKSSPA